ncbi:hypothetical protein ACOJBO_00670 [Rhizobium beringeri]
MLLTITHDVAVAKALGGMIGVMLDGRLVEYGPTGSVARSAGACLHQGTSCC